MREGHRSDSWQASRKTSARWVPVGTRRGLRLEEKARLTRAFVCLGPHPGCRIDRRAVGGLRTSLRMKGSEPDPSSSAGSSRSGPVVGRSSDHDSRRFQTVNATSGTPHPPDAWDSCCAGLRAGGRKFQRTRNQSSGTPRVEHERPLPPLLLTAGSEPWRLLLRLLHAFSRFQLQPTFKRLLYEDPVEPPGHLFQ